ncbi:unnamed protein product [Durusdinium trenchii]|uniref:AIG1-type G domain-containing protein n=1 Tax=Durusdinium trenchii TaxID=1381693 RepID=A0ABP0J0Q6_9DINO
MDLREVACGSHKSILLVDSPGINQCRRGCIQLIHSVFKDNLLNVFLAFWQTVHLRQKEHVLDEVKRADYVMFLMKATSLGTESEEKLGKHLQNYSTPCMFVLSHLGSSGCRTAGASDRSCAGICCEGISGQGDKAVLH